MDTRFGQSWLIRAGLLLLVLPALRRPDASPPPLVNGVDARARGRACSPRSRSPGTRAPAAGRPFGDGHRPRSPRRGRGLARRRRRPRRRCSCARVVPHDAPRSTPRASRAIAAPAIAVVAVSGLGAGLAPDRRARLGVRHDLRPAAAHEDRPRRADRRGREREPRTSCGSGQNGAREPLPAGPGAARVEADPEDIARPAQRGDRRGRDRGARAGRHRRSS